MYITIELDNITQPHTALNFDSTKSKWVPANDTNSLIGILLEPSYQDEQGRHWGLVGISGIDTYLIADENIPDEGGFLFIRNDGRAYCLPQSNGSCGTIAPVNVGETSRLIDSSIMVYLR